MNNEQKEKKIVEVPGFEPGAFRMQSECDTTTPHPQAYQPTASLLITNGFDRLETRHLSRERTIKVYRAKFVMQGKVWTK